MTKFTRRDFLKTLPAVPFVKLAWNGMETAAANLREQAQSSDQPNILFLVFDTLSAKHVTLYGYERDTTPNFARFAERATVFHNFRSTANFTSSATSSMFTGTYPWTHRAFHLHGTIAKNMVGNNFFQMLPDSYHKVAYTHNLLVTSLLHQFGGEIDQFKQTRELCLVDNEYADRLFNGDYSVAFWGEETALRSGATAPGTLYLSLFDRLNRFATKSDINNQYADQYPLGVPSLHNLFFLLEDAIDWIGQEVNRLPQPFLGYFHLLPPHEPYTPRRDFLEMFKQDGFMPVEKEKHRFGDNFKQGELNFERRLYDEFLAFTDSEFGRLIDMLEENGIFENSYVILTSDHGELFERGIRGHVTPTLFDPLLHVPLLISKPGQQSRTDVFSHTSSVDLLPTLLSLTNQPIPDWVEGAPLPTFGNEAVDEKRPIYALEAKSNPKMAPINKATLVQIKENKKLIHYKGHQANNPEGFYELYDLENDPEELVDLYDAGDPVSIALKSELESKLEAANQPFNK